MRILATALLFAWLAAIVLAGELTGRASTVAYATA